jgi:hypothetical protein
LTEVPVTAFVTIPSLPTTDEWMTANYDYDLVHDFEMSAYPYLNVFTDFDEVWTQTVTISAATAADRFMHKIGVISACNSFDESAFHYVVGDECEYTDESLDCGNNEYDLFENGGEFYTYLPSIEMEYQDLSSPACFETTYTLFNEDGSDYTGPFYLDGDILRLDNPYEWLGETIGVRIEITKQQPISDYVFTMPFVTG